jgi:hypothetical protein
VYAQYSRDGFLEVDASAERHSARQNLLVGRRQIGTLSEAGQVDRALYGLAGGGHSGVDQNSLRSDIEHQKVAAMEKPPRLRVRGTKTGYLVAVIVEKVN